MDKSQAIKLLGGTIARGILWATAAISARMGIENISKDTAQGVGMFFAAIILALLSSLWSHRKDKKLLQTPPKK
ncbi:MAG: hypothetical protein J7L99_00440 [Planctomycetes bacterium]|nr:hypothetical protein [Planctomycetota bacterium]